MQIAFLGLGTMGLPMATNLVKAGYQVTAWDRFPEQTEKFRLEGGKPAESPASAVRGADVVVSMLADDFATRATLIDSEAIAEMDPGAIHINMATISVALSRELTELHAEHDGHYVAAPVLGRPPNAQAGQLHILAAGPEGVLATIGPIFDVLGQRTWHIGDRPEQGNAAKLAANFMIGSAIEAMSEAVALAAGYAVDKRDFIEMITNTVFDAAAYRNYGRVIAEDRFDPPGFKLALGLKDVKLALDAAEQANVPLLLGNVLRDVHIDSLAHGEGGLDWGALSRVAARRAAQTS